jgi:hypothetical protein
VLIDFFKRLSRMPTVKFCSSSATSKCITRAR